MNAQPQNGELILAFYSLHETQDRNGYLGAMLVADSDGVPIEFRCTHAVRPNTVQKTLYGATLVPYIGVTLGGAPLAKALQNRPDVIFVSREDFLDIREESQCPVVAVRRAGESIEVQPGPDRANATERLDCPSGRFQPVQLVSHPEHPDDVALATSILSTVFSRFDPVEPFERISSAVDVLTKQDERFQ